MAAMKDSGIEWIGIIPEEWSVGRISYRYNLALGKMIEPDAGDSERAQYPYLCAANIKWNGVDTSINKKMYFSASERLQYDVKRGDLLITEGGSVGTSCIYDEEFGPVCYMQNSVIRARSRNGNQNAFLRYWLEFVCNSGYLEALCNKATISHYTKDKVSKTPLVLIGDSETKAIANKLDEDCAEIEALVSTIEKQITILERYRASVIHEAATRGLDPTAPVKNSDINGIGIIPESWVLRKLKHVLSTFESGTSVRAANYPADKGEKGVLSLSAVFGGRYNPRANKRIDDDELNRASCHVKTGCLLVSRCNTSELVGLPAYVENGCRNLYLPDKLWQLDSGQVDVNRFIYYAMQSKHAREYCAVKSVGSSESMQNIASFDLLNMYIALPSEPKEAKQIADYLDARTAAIDAVLETKRKQLDVLNRRRQSLIYEYVTGKRRVAEED